MDDCEWEAARSASLANAVQSLVIFAAPTALSPALLPQIGIGWVPMPAAVVHLALAVLLFPSAWFVERYGPAQSMRAGLAILVLVMVFAAIWATTSLLYILMFHALLGMAASLTGLPIYTVLVFAWLFTDRAAILGMGMASFEFSAVLGVPVLLASASIAGWSATWGLLAFLLFLVFPLSFVYLEEPKDDSEVAVLPVLDSVQRQEAEVEAPNRPDDALSDSADTVLYHDSIDEYVDPAAAHRFWTLFASAFFSHCGFGALQENVFVALTNDKGWTQLSACFVLVAFLAIAAGTKYLLCELGDRMRLRLRIPLVSNIALASAATALIFMMANRLSTAFAVIAIFLASISFSSSSIGRYYIVSQAFDHGIGAVQSSLFLGELMGHAFGAALTGFLRHMTGSYSLGGALAFVSTACGPLLSLLAAGRDRYSIGGEGGDDVLMETRTPPSLGTVSRMAGPPIPHRGLGPRSGRFDAMDARLFNMSAEFVRGGLSGTSRGSFTAIRRRRSSMSDYGSIPGGSQRS